MPFTREVITLQIGHYANFVGAHWWNLQDSQFSYNPNFASSKEVNHEVLFREGLTLQNEVTFTPRLIIVDLKGSLNAMKPEGTLYDLPNKTSDVIWDKYVVHKVEASRKNEFLQDIAKEEDEYLFRKENASSGLDLKHSSFDSNSEIPSLSKKIYNLDSNIEVWSDFLRLHFHPKSVLTLPGYYHDSNSENFDVFGYGLQALTNQKTLEAFEDKLHFFSEECDRLQGFQLLLDTHDGFGGVAANIAQLLVDEFPSKGILTWSVHPTANQVHNNISLINTLFSFEKLSGYSSLLSPLSLAQNICCRASKPKTFPHLNYNESLNYHTSAILGAYLDSVTLPYRLKTHRTDLRELAQNLTITGRSMVLSSLGFPFVLGEDSVLTQTLEEFSETVPWQCLTPGCDIKSNCNIQSLVLRGVPKNKISNNTPSFNNSRQISQKLYQSCSSDEILKVFVEQLCPGTISACSVVDNACKVIAPFPNIFSTFVNKNGLISNIRRSENEVVDQVPVIAGLHASKEIYKLLQYLSIEAQHCKIRKCHKLFDAGMEMDDYKEMLNNIECLTRSYQDS